MKNSIIFFILILFLSSPLIYAQPINMLDENGKKQGFWEKYNEEGFLLYKGQFEHGIPVDTFYYYYPDGYTIKVRSVFYNDGSRTHTNIYHYNGQIMSEGNYQDKKKDSLWTYFTDEGVKLKEEFYRKEVKEGVWKTFYPNGNIVELVSWKDGKQHGLWQQYSEDGSLNEEVYYQDDELHGDYKQYAPDGWLHVEGQFEHAQKTGSWKEFDEDGNLILEEIYDKGKLIEKNEYPIN